MNSTSTSAIVPAGTNPILAWNQLRPKEKAIVMAVVYEGSPGQAQKTLNLSHSTFYRNWAKLKPFYNQLLQEFPKVASQILVSQTIKAAQVLGEQLDSNNESIRQKAAIQILTRVINKDGIVENKIKSKKEVNILELLTGCKREVDNSLEDPETDPGLPSPYEVSPESRLMSIQDVIEQPPLLEPEPAEDLSWQDRVDMNKVNNRVPIPYFEFEKGELLKSLEALNEWESNHIPGPCFLKVKSEMETRARDWGYI